MYFLRDAVVIYDTLVALVLLKVGKKSHSKLFPYSGLASLKRAGFFFDVGPLKKPYYFISGVFPLSQGINYPIYEQGSLSTQTIHYKVEIIFFIYNSSDY